MTVLPAAKPYTPTDGPVVVTDWWGWGAWQKGSCGMNSWGVKRRCVCGLLVGGGGSKGDGMVEC